MKNYNYQKIFISAYFLIIFTAGVGIFKDYGVPWDEGICNLNGVINAFEINDRFNNIIISEDKVEKFKYSSNDSAKIVPLYKFQDRFYGSINELILLAPSFVLKKLNDTQSIYLIRHFTIFLIFWISLIFFYFLIYSRFKSFWLALLGTTFLLFTPRIFAHSFYNSKDLIFLPFLILSLFSAIKFIEKKTIKTAILHALFTGLLIAVRIPGIYILVLTLFIFTLDLIIKNKLNRENEINFENQISFSKYIKKPVIYLFIYLLLSIIFTIVFWPFLWDHPIRHFLESYAYMSKFKYHPAILFLGNIINSSKLPWYYAPVWILISTPVLYSILFIFGFISIVFSSTKDFLNSWKYKKLGCDIFMFLAFLLPILAEILEGSTLYNDWRHLYFIYPPFLIISILGFSYLFYKFKNKIFKIILVLFVTVSLCSTGYIMIKLHPYEMVYFNCLVQNPNLNFEYEYWGLTYLEGLNKIMEIDKSNPVVLYRQPTSPIPGTLRIMDKNKRERIKFSEKLEDSKYFMDNYHSFYNNQDNFMKFYNLKKSQEIYSIKRNGITLLSIFRLDSSNKVNHNLKIPLLKLYSAKPY